MVARASLTKENLTKLQNQDKEQHSQAKDTALYTRILGLLFSVPPNSLAHTQFSWGKQKTNKKAESSPRYSKRTSDDSSKPAHSPGVIPALIPGDVSRRWEIKYKEGAEDITEEWDERFGWRVRSSTDGIGRSLDL